MKRILNIDFENLYYTLEERIYKKYEFFEDYDDPDEIEYIFNEEITLELELEWIVRHLGKDERIDLLKNIDIFNEVDDLIMQQEYEKGDDLNCIIYDAVSNLIQEAKKRIEKERDNG